MPRTFGLNVALACVHNVACSQFHELRDLLDYMTAEIVPIWDFSRARKMCAQALLEKYPTLDHFPPPAEFQANSAGKYVRKIAALTKITEVEVEPVLADTYTPRSLSEKLADQTVGS